MRGKSRPGFEAGEIRQVHDLSPCLPQGGCRAASAEEERAEIEIEYCIPPLRGGVLEAESMHNGCRVDQHVEAAEPGNDALWQAGRDIRVSEIGLKADRAPPRLAA